MMAGLIVVAWWGPASSESPSSESSVLLVPASSWSPAPRAASRLAIATSSPPPSLSTPSQSDEGKGTWSMGMA